MIGRILRRPQKFPPIGVLILHNPLPWVGGDIWAYDRIAPPLIWAPVWQRWWRATPVIVTYRSLESPRQLQEQLPARGGNFGASWRWQPVRRQGPTSFSGKQMNSANNCVGLKEDPGPRKKRSPPQPVVALRGPKQRASLSWAQTDPRKWWGTDGCCFKLLNWW